MNVNEININENKNAYWKKILGILETQLNPTSFNIISKRAIIKTIKEKQITIAVDSKFWLKKLKTFESLIEAAITKVIGPGYEIKYLEEEIKKEKEENTELPGPLFKSKKEESNVDPKVQSRSGLSPRFTFSNYIMGNSNQLAFAIAETIAQSPGSNYNPFFLYSDVGLGKTHLVQAIGNKILHDNPKYNVVYTTGENFTNEMIDALQSAKGRGKYLINEFRKKFRKADVLIIDDVQFIVGRDSTQQEFFHTFNALYMAGKQIVLTSDRPPKDFTNLEKRISSRFGSGIIADIQAPDVDMKNAILRYKRDSNRDEISNDLIDYIAQKVQSNVRELEGAYNQVLTEIRAIKTPPTKDLIDGILGKNIDVHQTKALNMNQVLKIVCKYYAVTSTDIKGKRRTKDIVIPRQVSMYLIKELTGMPYIGIGKFLGNRDHTTIMHGVEKVEKEILEVGKLRQDILNIKAMI